MFEGAFFRRDGDRFIPNDKCGGFWSEDSLHGRAIVGLIGHEIERRHGDEGLVPARLTVDMHRLARMRPVEISTRVIREGGRMRLVEATMSSEGLEYARGTCQFLRATDQPPGRVWRPATDWNAPHPDEVEPLDHADLKQLSEWRVFSGGMGVLAPRKMWMRESFDMVEGAEMTPFTRMAMAADLASPWIHSSDKGIFYINTDIVLQLHRLMRGEWLGFEATGHDASQGIAIGNCRLYDLDGPIGYVGVTALSNRRK